MPGNQQSSLPTTPQGAMGQQQLHPHCNNKLSCSTVASTAASTNCTPRGSGGSGDAEVDLEQQAAQPGLSMFRELSQNSQNERWEKLSQRSYKWPSLTPRNADGGSHSPPQPHTPDNDIIEPEPGFEITTNTTRTGNSLEATTDQSIGSILSDVKKRKKNCRWMARWVVLSPFFQLFMFLVLVVDFSAFVVEIVYDWDGNYDEAPQNAELVVFVIGSAMLGCYCLEVALGVYGFGCRNFGRDLWNVLDLVVLSAALVLTYLESSTSSVVVVRALKFGKHSKLLKFLGRVLRCVHVVQRTRQRTKAFRTIVSKNKFRYLDLRNNFDLDLTYIAGDLIAMGVPVSGCFSSMYRNPIWDVARLFRHRHDGHFRIYNLCPELPYADDRFTQIGGSVKRFEVEDHTPPTMDQFVEFLHDARDFRSSDASNVMAVHCKAGKGRTGSFCCAWLLYSRKCKTAESALDMFGRRRTDQRLRGKVRGVETPSQVRFVRQLGQHLEKTDSWFFSSHPPPAVPTPALRLRRLALGPGLFVKPETLKSLRVLVQWTDPVTRTEQSREASAEGPPPAAPPQEGAEQEQQQRQPGPGGVDLGGLDVRADVRISLFAAKPGDFSAKGSMAAVRNPFKAKGLLMFFTFHTGFVEMLETEEGCCQVPVEEMDKASKQIKKGRVAPGTHVKLWFSREATSSSPPPHEAAAAEAAALGGRAEPVAV